MDVKKTFLNGFIEYEVVIKQLEGYETFDRDSHVLRLKEHCMASRMHPMLGTKRLTSISLFWASPNVKLMQPLSYLGIG